MVEGPKHSYWSNIRRKMIYLLVAGPHNMVKSWQVYDINGFTFYINAKDHRS
jgi:hypothetical protein